MKEIKGEIQFKEKTYPLLFNLNVMEAIQEEYGSVEEWGRLTDGESGEPNAKAVIFGFREMINEGLDVENEENGTDIQPLTLKQVGRIISHVGLAEATMTLNQTVTDSTQSDEKNG